MKFISSFSGGKDSMLAVHRMVEAGHTCNGLITTTDNENIQSWVHNIDLTILKELACSLNMPFYPIGVNPDDYADDFKVALLKLKENVEYDAIVFGDIDIEEHREWCENLCREVNVRAIFPLWQEEREKLVLEFINAGYQAVIKKVMKDKLSKDFLSKQLDLNLIETLKKEDVDICGENGEYHTLVYDGPLFSKGLALSYQDITENEYSYDIGMKLK